MIKAKKLKKLKIKKKLYYLYVKMDSLGTIQIYGKMLHQLLPKTSIGKHRD